MKFDAIVGNPPYQIVDGGGNGASRVLTFERDAELRQHAAAVVAQRYMALRDRADFGARFNKQHLSETTNP